MIGEELIVDYLIYLLNSVQNETYVNVFQLKEATDDTDLILSTIATKYKQLNKGGISNTLFAARLFLKKFRAGELGLSLLDPL